METRAVVLLAALWPAMTAGLGEKSSSGDVLDLRTALQSKDGGAEFEVDPAALPALGLADGDLVPPKRTRRVAPVYPEAARVARAEGAVGLDCRIEADGKVSRCRVHQSVHSDLDRAAVDAVRQWRYRPATVKGEARPVLVRLEMKFRLR